MARKDELGLAKVLTPDFQTFDTDGVRSDRAKVLSDLRKLFVVAKTLKATIPMNRFTIQNGIMVAPTHSEVDLGNRRVRTEKEQTWVCIDGRWKLKQVRTVTGQAWLDGKPDPLPGGPKRSRGWLDISPVRIVKKRYLAD